MDTQKKKLEDLRKMIQQELKNKLKNVNICENIKQA